MEQKWIWSLVILVFYQKMTSGANEATTIEEGHSFDIQCDLKDMGTMIVWLRVLDKSGMEFIASFSPNGMPKSQPDSFSSIFRYTGSRLHTLTLQSFKKDRDSGAYSCASLVKGNELRFGTITRLVGKKAEVAIRPTLAANTKQNPCTTAKPCVCTNNNKQEKTSPSMFCAPIILGPLAGGCGLLLLLLIITTLYCNHIRTRRCPHHHRRKPRMAPGKQVMTNRHV